jgi:hypothetical protein
MASEIIMGISALKAAFDMAKALKDIDNAATRNAAVIELQEKILTAQEHQSALIQHVRNLEKEVADFKAWDAEKARYERKNVGYGAFAYMLKPDARGTETPHWACTNCYENGKIKTLQYGNLKKGEGLTWFCPQCHNTIRPHVSEITWLD